MLFFKLTKPLMATLLWLLFRQNNFIISIWYFTSISIFLYSIRCNVKGNTILLQLFTVKSAIFMNGLSCCSYIYFWYWILPLVEVTRVCSGNITYDTRGNRSHCDTQYCDALHYINISSCLLKRGERSRAFFKCTCWQISYNIVNIGWRYHLPRCI